VTLALNGRSAIGPEIGPEIGDTCGERKVSAGASCPGIFYLTEPSSFPGVPECCCHSSLSFGCVEVVGPCRSLLAPWTLFWLERLGNSVVYCCPVPIRCLRNVSSQSPGRSVSRDVRAGEQNCENA
jgi:hypothetical protein